MKYERRTIGQIKAIIAAFDQRSPDETADEAAQRLGVYRMQIKRWRDTLNEWAEAGYTDEHVPVSRKTRITRHRQAQAAK